MITLIIGDVPLLQRRALAQIRQEQGDRIPTSFYGPECKAQDLQEACANLSLLSDGSFVIVRAADRLPRKEQERLRSFLQKIHEDVCLVFLADKIDRRLKFWQELIAHAQVISCEAPPSRERPTWLRQECQRRGLQLTPEAFQVVTEEAFIDMNQALLLLDKVELYVGNGKKVNGEAIEACRIGGSPVKIFEWAEAVGAGEWQRALLILQFLWSHQESPLAILALLIRHFRILLKALENRDSWGRRQDMARLLGVPPFVVDRYLKQARSYSRDQLLNIWQSLLETDRALKSSPSRKEWELEALLWTLQRKKLAC